METISSRDRNSGIYYIAFFASFFAPHALISHSPNIAVLAHSAKASEIDAITSGTTTKNFLENGWFVNYYLIIFLKQWPAIIL